MHQVMAYRYQLLVTYHSNLVWEQILITVDCQMIDDGELQRDQSIRD